MARSGTQRDENGHIIQISSIGGRRTAPGLGAYQSAKWAVGGFSEVLAREVAPLGIRVTCVEPGGMRTDMFGLSMLDETIASDYKPTVDAVLRGIFGSADRARNDPAKVILRLAEEEQPPVRLLLGSDAVFLAAAAAAERAEEDARWKTLSISTDYDGLGCDSGVLTCFYAKRFPNAHVLGVDVLPESVQCAQQLAAKAESHER